MSNSEIQDIVNDFLRDFGAMKRVREHVLEMSQNMLSHEIKQASKAFADGKLPLMTKEELEVLELMRKRDEDDRAAQHKRMNDSIVRHRLLTAMVLMSALIEWMEDVEREA